jgi:hypothetical protein
MKKNKWDIIGSDLDKLENSISDYWLFWYDGEYYFDHDYGQYYTYDYSEPVYREYFSKRGKWIKDRHLVGNYIDMMSIYSSQVLRQKKIDYLLGIDKWEVTSKPTILDYINYKKGNERN